MANQSFIEIDNISKKFGNTQALNNVNFQAAGGEIHAILGENGAGKTTLVNILSGVIKPDSGSVKILGQDIQSFDPARMICSSVATVFQNLSLIPSLTVAENLFLRDAHRPVKYREEYTKSQDLLQHYSIKDIDPFKIVEDLSLNQKQKIEIIKALFRQPKVLMLDEPTSALNPPEVEWLLEIIQQLKKENVCILYISHRIAEVRELCDKISVLRNGEKVGTFQTKEVSDSQIVEKMLGHHLVKGLRSAEKVVTKEDVILQVENAYCLPELKPTNLFVHKGEILGMAGLAGQGQMDFFKILFGIQPCPACQVIVQGQSVHIKSPIDAIKAGIVFLPAERNNNTMFLGLSTKQNMTVAILKKISDYGWLNQKQEEKLVDSISKSLNININHLNNRISSLSGGNQQKALLGKWLLTNSSILLLYDPTRGVDIGTKFEIIKFVKQIAESGKTVIYYSTDIDELVEISDRVIVFYQGQICDEFIKTDIKSEKILQSVTGIE